jgi:pilus assembly protein CpaE
VSIALYTAGTPDRIVEQFLVDTGLRVVRTSADDLEGLAQAAAPQPDILVLDLRRDRRILALVGVLRTNHPTTPVLVIAPSLDPKIMLEAMRAGVNECLAEPLERTQFLAIIRRVMEKREAAQLGAVFAFLGAKGGVGSTTLAVNVATAVSQIVNVKLPEGDTPSQTLLADFHLMYGDCALFLGSEPRFSIADVLEKSHRIDQAFLRGVVARHPGGPDLLSSASQLKSPATDLRRIETLLQLVRQQYRYTFIDLPRSDSAILDSLAAVTEFAIVVNQDIATLRAARTMGALVRQRYGNKVQFVINRHDPQAEITAADVEDALGEPVRHVIPSDYRVAVQAVNSGLPIVPAWPGKLAHAIKTYATQLTGVAIPVPPVVAARRPFLARLAAVRSLFA